MKKTAILAGTSLLMVALPCLGSGEGAQDSSSAPLQRRLLNAMDVPGGIGAWNIDKARTALATGIEPKVGNAVVEMSGIARIKGGKGDAVVYEGTLPGCQRLSVWLYLKPESNVSEIGLQIKDAKGERLSCLVPADWTGWKLLEINPAKDVFKPSYEQKDQDGKVDLPLSAVNLVWFTKEAGPTSVGVDGLTALTELRPGEAGVKLLEAGSLVAEPGLPLSARLMAENLDGVARTVSLHYTLQANPTFNDSPPPDPVLGFDHALGCVNTFTVDGEEKGPAKLCDGDDNSCVEAPWGSGYKEATALIDLGVSRNISAVHYVAGDANWIWKADVLTSVDGVTFTPVAVLQRFDIHKKWNQQVLPWPAQPVPARWLKFRFHNDGKETNCIRLPVSVMVYDGAANDRLEVPHTGEQIAEGNGSATLPPHDFAEVMLTGTVPVPPGAYLLGLDAEVGGRKEVRWTPYLVRPATEADTAQTGRFGINASDVALATEMRRCGFGWVRFENAKWQMFCTAKDKYAFDGSVDPWNVDQNKIYSTYQGLGMKVLPYVFQPPAWASSAPKEITKNRAGYPPVNNADYGDAVFQLVAWAGSAKVDPAKLLTPDKQTGTKLINAVELWNEPNLNDPGWGPFVGTMPQYFEVMRAGAEGARRADPALPVSSGGLAGISLEVVGQLASYKYQDGKTPLDFVDIINVHFYSGREEPEICGWDPNVNRAGHVTGGHTYPEEIEDLVAWRDQVKPKAEIWLTETGNDVGGPIGRTERYQAAKVPRAVMLALAAGVEKVFVYREKGSTPTQHAGAGLLRNDLTVRPQWFTVATMIRQLQGFEGKALRLPSADPKVWMFLWKTGTRQLITAWRYEGTEPLGIDLGKASVCDAFGRVTEVKETAGVVLSEMPVYITLAGSTPAYEKLLKEAAATREKHRGERAALTAVTTRLFDFGPAGQRLGMLKGYGLPRWYTPVGKGDVWDEARGYGFVLPVTQDLERRWVHDPLERDSCKLNADNAFKFILPAGQFTVRVSAEPIGGTPTEVILKTAAGAQSRTVDKKAHLAEFVVEGGPQPVEVTFPKYGSIFSITAIAQGQK
ncbi:MAG: hypothetical protein WCS52_07915 [bacterium]